MPSLVCPAVGGITSYRAGLPGSVGCTVTSMQLSPKFNPDTGAAYQNSRNDLLHDGCVHCSRAVRLELAAFGGRQ